MYLGYQNNIIVAIDENKENLENDKSIKFDKIEYTEEPVKFVWDTFIVGEENIKISSMSFVRMLRNNYINQIQWRIERYNQQKELNIFTTDSHDEYKNILLYIQYLRDFTNQEKWWEKEPLVYDDWKKDVESDSID